MAEDLAERLGDHPASDLRPILAACILRARTGNPETFVVGLCGPQGAGKSTLAAGLVHELADHGVTTAVLSIDDLYLTRRERRALAADVHPLLAVRGPPGTHDVQLGLDTFYRLARAGPVQVPRFDKATDERKPHVEWPTLAGPAQVVLFEGWCVGARPQDAAELAQPINLLERDCDPEAVGAPM